MLFVDEYVIIFLQYHLSQRQAGRIPPIKRHGLISSDRYRIKYMVLSALHYCYTFFSSEDASTMVQIGKK